MPARVGIGMTSTWAPLTRQAPVTAASMYDLLHPLQEVGSTVVLKVLPYYRRLFCKVHDEDSSLSGEPPLCTGQFLHERLDAHPSSRWSSLPCPLHEVLDGVVDHGRQEHECLDPSKLLGPEVLQMQPRWMGVLMY